MSASVQSIIDIGAAGIGIDIECNVTNGLPAVIIVGFANKAVDEARNNKRDDSKAPTKLIVL